MWLRGRSLKRWLLGLLSISFVIVYTFIVAATYYKSDHEINEIYDANLIGSASRIEAMVKLIGVPKLNEIGSAFVNSERKLSSYYSPISVAVISSDKGVFVASNPEFKTLLLEYMKTFSFNEAGLVTLESEGKSWRVFVLSMEVDNSSKSFLVVGEPIDYRQIAVLEIIEVMGLPILVGLPIMIFLLSLVINIGFQQLNRFSRSITEQSPQKIIESSLEKDCPSELAPLVSEIKQLLYRAQEQTEQEKDFIANAAHELKTPIAVLKLQVGLLNSDNIDCQVKKINTTLKRTENLIQQLLNLQYLEVMELDKTYFSLNNVLLEVHELLSPLLERKELLVNYNLPSAEVFLSSSSFWVKQLLVNILSNAMHYTPLKGSVLIKMEDIDGRVTIEIVDSGDGLSSEEMIKVTERFFRLNKHKGDPVGSGLGLSIVKGICEKYDIELVMANSERLGGLIVSLKF